MGLDMSLYRVKRKIFESISREDFWTIASEYSNELQYWRKEYEIGTWFFENTIIKEEYSDELNKEKLEKLSKWLLEKGFKEYSENINSIIKYINFDKYVVYYSHCN